MLKKLAAIALVLTVASTQASCSWLKSEGKTAETAAVACAQQDLGQTVTEAGASLLMTVSSILFNGGTNWMADLTALAAKYGEDAVTCAAHIAEALFQMPSTGSGSGSSGPSTADSDTAAGRAHQWVVGSHLVLK